MKKHTKVWLDHFGEPFCEITGHDGLDSKDIHHIDARGMGGRKGKDNVVNLMMIKRELHTFVEMNPSYSWWFSLVHAVVLIYKKPYHELDISKKDPIFEEIMKRVYEI